MYFTGTYIRTCIYTKYKATIQCAKMVVLILFEYQLFCGLNFIKNVKLWWQIQCEIAGTLQHALITVRLTLVLGKNFTLFYKN